MNETVWIACGVVLLAIATSHHFLQKAITTMAVTQATFDQDLDALLKAQTAYVTAAQAKFTALEAVAPAGSDFSAEDAQVASASAGLATALAAVNPTAAPSVPAASAAVAAGA
jgi:hypothetical protein